MNSPIPIVICDDSRLARKQMARAIAGWNVEITEVSNGLQALEAIRAGKGHLLFLDLNMPIMDGYEVLERIHQQDLKTLVIVVSGDIQHEARRRVRALGALGFISKPINTDMLRQFLADYGLSEELEERDVRISPIEVTLQLQEYYQELANVSMGRAAERLNRLLGAFIRMPIPNVQTVESADIKALLGDAAQPVHNQLGNVICQGFLGPSISGEALAIFDRFNLEDVARLLRYEGALTLSTQRELLMDIANVLISAFLGSLGEQLQDEFYQSVPVIIGQHYAPPTDAVLRRWKRSLAIELNYQISGHDLSCTVLVLFTEDSLTALNEKTRHLL